MRTLLEREIAEQGAVLARRSAKPQGAIAAAARLLERRDVDHVVIAARGSSDNAARFAQYLMGDTLGLEVSLAAPWLYRESAHAPQLGGAAVIAISQSGCSPDIVRVLQAARLQRRPTMAITGDPASPLAHHADVIVPLRAGEERSVAATKSYLASLHAIAQTVDALTRNLSDWLAQLPMLVSYMAADALTHRDRFDALAGLPLITVTGRGLAFAAACETALKLRELSGRPAEAFSPPDLMHGPIAALDGTGGTWLIEPDEDEINACLPRAAATVIVSGDPVRRARATLPIALPPDLPSWVSSILAVLPAQAAALRLAEQRGVDVDSPHGLHKITLTR